MNFKLMEDLAKYLASKAPDLVDGINEYVLKNAERLGKLGEASVDNMSQIALSEMRNEANKREGVIEDPELPDLTQDLPSISDVIDKGKDLVKTGKDVYKAGEDLSWGRITPDEYMKILDDKVKKPTGVKPTKQQEEDYYLRGGPSPYLPKGSKFGTSDMDFADRETDMQKLRESLDDASLGTSIQPYADKEYSDNTLSKYRGILEDWSMLLLDDSGQVDMGVKPEKRLITTFNGFNPDGTTKWKKSDIKDYKKGLDSFNELMQKDVGALFDLRPPVQDEVDDRDTAEILAKEYEGAAAARAKRRIRTGESQSHQWDKDSIFGFDTISEDGTLTQIGWDKAMSDESSRDWTRYKSPRDVAEKWRDTHDAWSVRFNEYYKNRKGGDGNPFWVVPKNNHGVPLQINHEDQLRKLVTRARERPLNYVVEVMFGNKDAGTGKGMMGVVPYFEGDTIRQALRTLEKESSRTRFPSNLKAPQSEKLAQVPNVLKKFIDRPVPLTNDIVDEVLENTEQGQQALRAGMAEIDALYGNLKPDEVRARKIQIDDRVRKRAAAMIKDWFLTNTDLGDAIIEEAFKHFFD